MLFDKIINTAFSFGAAIVIFGAWGKIEHKEFGSTALTAGLLTETAIFCIYGAMEWRKKPGAPGDSVQGDGTLAGAGTLEEQGDRGLVQPGRDSVQGAQADRHGGRADQRGWPVEAGTAPVQPEQVEALTDSIRQASQVLTRIFRL